MARFYKSGLTLVELLISITIFSIIVTITLFVFFNTQQVEKKLQKSWELNREIDLFIKKISRSIKETKKILRAEANSLEIININNDTIRYCQKNHRFYKNGNPISPLLIDSLSFRYITISEMGRDHDYLNLEKNGDGFLEDKGLHSIFGIGIELQFLTSENKRVDRRVFIRLKNLERF
ncbi:hypothetical protein BXT86_02455 [candidate division WOR-3 bacterium 4484_100]|uniref:Prepilin-type N-terminal cleavage/methylation domain-containing protein n=1 Tax=candidate division WOR-3 bacterium 4484_100 TaxID=1936077 RepID=A0A1V4QFR4_UNCW3|nr:MAG: hypothetical protein BXT86_02455 [candidate division WOR-3 bacterium 4484_100]